MNNNTQSHTDLLASVIYGKHIYLPIHSCIQEARVLSSGHKGSGPISKYPHICIYHFTPSRVLWLGQSVGFLLLHSSSTTFYLSPGTTSLALLSPHFPYLQHPPAMISFPRQHQLPSTLISQSSFHQAHAHDPSCYNL